MGHQLSPRGLLSANNRQAQWIGPVPDGEVHGQYRRVGMFEAVPWGREVEEFRKILMDPENQAEPEAFARSIGDPRYPGMHHVVDIV